MRYLCRSMKKYTKKNIEKDNKQLNPWIKYMEKFTR